MDASASTSRRNTQHATRRMHMKYNLKIEILFEDEHIIVANKPAGLCTCGERPRTLELAINCQCERSTASDSLETIRAAHRLDAPTMGLVVLAKSLSALQKTNQQFADRQVKKTYRALAVGKLTKNGTFDSELDEKHAVTHYEVEEIIPSHHLGYISQVKINLETGRTHQIRRHFQMAGFPLVGDSIYGGKKNVTGKGLMLAAVGLEFVHPITNKLLKFETDLPSKFLSLKRRQQRFKNMNLDTIFEKIDKNIDLAKPELIYLLDLEDEKEIERLYEKAYEVKLREVGNQAYFRGIVEFSNVCDKDCYYCGIRKSNKNSERFNIPEEDVIKSAVWSYNAGYGSVVLQSGERSDKEFVDRVERMLKAIKSQCDDKVGITISLGEQSLETYQRWFSAGAHRYLLRIETTNPELYKKIHPDDELHSLETRIDCLKRLREAGYQVGTGVMIGLPFQTTEDLANDILFFKEMDVDMIGMGPYIFHEETPLAKYRKDWEMEKEELLTKGLKMIAVTRLFLKDVNIAATTALQALRHTGREAGLKAGANVIMPNSTDTKYRESYQLYENKPCTDENASMCCGCLERRIVGIGESVGFNEWGDSPHFKNRTDNNS